MAIAQVVNVGHALGHAPAELRRGCRRRSRRDRQAARSALRPSTITGARRVEQGRVDEPSRRWPRGSPAPRRSTRDGSLRDRGLDGGRRPGQGALPRHPADRRRSARERGLARSAAPCARTGPTARPALTPSGPARGAAAAGAVGASSSPKPSAMSVAECVERCRGIGAGRREPRARRPCASRGSAARSGR